MKTTSTYCTKCDKSFKSEQGLRVHNFRIHTHRGRRVARTLESKLHFFKERTSKDNSTQPTTALIYCPCCGTDIRKVQAALNVVL